MNPYQIIFSCEHAGNEVPEEYSEVFHPERGVLNSHLGYDYGAYQLARAFSLKYASPLYSNKVTRLLIDLNRSLHNQSVFSDYSWPLKTQLRSRLIATYYTPYRNMVESAIRKHIAQGRVVIHISVHSFTKDFHGEQRSGHTGVLFDEEKNEESLFSQNWLAVLKTNLPNYNHLPNYPYHGAEDGFTTYLRARYDCNYLGIELEVRDDLLRGKDRTYVENLVGSLQQAIDVYLDRQNSGILENEPQW
jgi:predicted N-formylglutamate amidohydrolase